MSTATYTVTELDPTTGEPRCTHIVGGNLKQTGIEVVFEARVNGTPVEALCGHVFVPERDAKQYPICSRCKAIREQMRPDQDPSEIPS